MGLYYRKAISEEVTRLSCFLRQHVGKGHYLLIEWL